MIGVVCQLYNRYFLNNRDSNSLLSNMIRKNKDENHLNNCSFKLPSLANVCKLKNLEKQLFSSKIVFHCSLNKIINDTVWK